LCIIISVAGQQSRAAQLLIVPMSLPSAHARVITNIREHSAF